MNEPIINKFQASKEFRTLSISSSLSLAAVTLVTFVMAILTPPLSGPFAASTVITYPYTDILARYPRDYFWMFPAMLLVLNFIVYMVCVDCYSSLNKKIFSRIALIFASLAAGIIFVDYFVQVAVIQPSLLNGEMQGIALLTQYNPHGLFIVLEEAGYLLMSFAILFLTPVFSGSGKLRAVLRWTAMLNFILTLLSLIVISMIFGLNREYRFEVAVITYDFIAMILLGLFSAKLFISRE